MVVVFGRLVCLVVAAPPAPKVSSERGDDSSIVGSILRTHSLRTGSCNGSLDSVPCREQWLRTNLVDPASSHMLVSKIKPCMSQYKLLYGETANGSLKQL